MTSKSTSTSQKCSPARRKSGYIRSLDGWRAIAILGVIWLHDLKPTPQLLPYEIVSGSGVYLFFAISGILITTRILEEESLCGFFDIGKFYVRRIFRIQPAAWLYLAVIGCLMAADVLHVLWKHWFGALGMYENFLYAGTAYDYQGFFVGHFWTLAVEEHFYILLSLFLLLVKRNRLAMLVWIFIGLMAFRVYAGMHGHLSDATSRRTYYQLPPLIYGACFAVALRGQNFRLWAERYLKPWIVFSVTLVFVVGRGFWVHTFSPSQSDLSPATFLGSINFLSTYMFAVWIVSTILHGESFATRILEWAPLRWIGRLSYSLYLWHVLFFFRDSAEVGVTLPALVALSGRPAKYLAAFAAASLSYYCVEKPLMRLGHRLAPPATPGRPELAETPPTRPLPEPSF
jgi:peptidoglycan/LPS O-acetylase OafA/YrhL